MTPKQAREIYYAALGESFKKHQLNWAKPISQLQCELEAWQVMLNDPDTPEAQKALMAYLEAKNTLKSSPYEVQRLWEIYTDICRQQMKENKDKK